MTIFRRFVLTAAITAVGIAAIYWAAFNYQFGAPIPASYDVANWLILKENIAKKTPGERILFVSDSNILFGLNSDTVEKKLGKPVINMGLHGGLPLDWILNVALRNARSGDTVVFPLVWGYYLKDYKAPNFWITDQIIAWDRSYFDELSIARKLPYIKSISIASIYHNIDLKIKKEEVLKDNPLRYLPPKEEVLSEYDKSSGMQTAFSYTYVNMNKHGDMRHTCGAIAPATGADYFMDKNSKVNREAIDLLSRVILDLNKRGVKSYVTAPVQVDDITTRSDWYQKIIADIWEDLRAAEIPVLGNQTSFFFKPSDFFNTNFHLNCESTEERSERLVKLLKPEL